MNGAEENICAVNYLDEWTHFMPGTPTPSFAVSVRNLVEFVLLSGSLERGTGFSGASGMEVALEGTLGHQKLQATRPDNYEAEVYLSQTVKTEEGKLKVRGRVDGILHQSDGSFLVEEIKTYSGNRELGSNIFHWGQGKVYAHMYAIKRAKQDPEATLSDDIVVQLAYLHRKTGEVTTFQNAYSRKELAEHFSYLCEEYMEWAVRQLRWLEERNASLDALTFPYPAYRPGQRALAVAAYQTIVNEGQLFAEAPTGIGKTMSMIFPAAKAMAQGELEKIFYLTARGTGRSVAQKAYRDLHKHGMKCRVLTLTARDKACLSDEAPCDTSTCPYAIGYYDRIKDALRTALSVQMLDRDALREIAEHHQVCPFELSLDAADWCDVIICDLNYVFDPNVYLRRFFSDPNGPYTFLVDEAHNLVDRARTMYSACLSKRSVLDMRKVFQQTLPALSKILFRINKGFVSWDKKRQDAPERTPELPKEEAYLRRSANEEGLVCQEPPSDLIEHMKEFLLEAESSIPDLEESPERSELLELYFQIRRFVLTADEFDERYMTLLTTSAKDTTLKLFCIDPSERIRQARQRGRSTLYFSATLEPIHYFRQLLGEEENDRMIQLPTPFPPEHLTLHIEDRVATTYRQRQYSYPRIAANIMAMLRQHEGNMMVFFPSYRYMQEVLTHFVPMLTDALEEWTTGQLLVQTPRMSEQEREAFLAAFTPDTTQTTIGFAVMGGVFSEGVDLVGDRLCNVVIVGVGLPQVCVERDLIRDYFEDMNGSGFAYAYSFPGMNKVLQAVGRLIRTETDKGAALLIDQRFHLPLYRRLFPPWWQPQRAAYSLRKHHPQKREGEQQSKAQPPPQPTPYHNDQHEADG